MFFHLKFIRTILSGCLRFFGENCVIWDKANFAQKEIAGFKFTKAVTFYRKGGLVQAVYTGISKRKITFLPVFLIIV